MYFWHCMITLYDLHCTCMYWTLDIVYDRPFTLVVSICYRDNYCVHQLHCMFM